MNHESFDVPRHIVQENDLQHNKELRVLQTLNPYVVNEISRVGGRLKNAALLNQQRYPIILPSLYHVTDLIIMMHHEEHGHMGTSHILAAFNKEYWIIHSRSVANRVLGGCMNCRF